MDPQFRDVNPPLSKQLILTATQASTAAPSTTNVLFNSTGTEYTWARVSAGLYTLTANTSAAAPFTAGKTVALVSFSGTATTCDVAVTSTTVLTFTFADSGTPSAADLAGSLALKVEVYS